MCILYFFLILMVSAGPIPNVDDIPATTVIKINVHSARGVAGGRYRNCAVTVDVVGLPPVCTIASAFFDFCLVFGCRWHANELFFQPPAPSLLSQDCKSERTQSIKGVTVFNIDEVRCLSLCVSVCV